MRQNNPDIPGTADSNASVTDNDARNVNNDFEDFLTLARIGYEEGDTFQEESLKKRWDDNYHLARSEFPPGSKYNLSSYKRKSKIFRGKTEASIRKNEAACTVALFSNQDTVTIRPPNQDDPAMVTAAKALHEITNVRLEGVNWFMVALGAYHETMVPGHVVSKQYWDSDVGEDGVSVYTEPVIELIEPENVKISPSADWIDPINSSPYAIVQTPMFVCDIRESMEKGEWQSYTDHEILSSVPSEDNKSTKDARGADAATATTDETSSIDDYSTAMVHENYVRKDGIEYVFLTLGTRFILTLPALLEEVYPHTALTGKRNLTMGTSAIETFNVYKRSLTDRVKGNQNLTNEMVNQRIENVKLVTNRRYFAQRNMGIDFATMTKSVAGSIILTNDINAIKPEEVRDVTSSSYQEQHLLNADFDELAGSFSQSSVSTNRQLNDTVGGMQMLKGSSNELTEYQLLVFVKTWVEPVMKEFVAMVQTYESPEVIATITGEQLTAEQLLTPFDVRVSVGFGATDPMGKVNRLLTATTILMERFPQLAQQFNPQAFSDELFGAMGYNDGKKFYMPEEQDPQVAALQQQLEQLMGLIESGQLEHQNAMEIEQQKGRNALVLKAMDRQVKLTSMAMDSNQKAQDRQAKQGPEQARLQMDTLKALSDLLMAKTQAKELQAKMSGVVESGI